MNIKRVPCKGWIFGCSAEQGILFDGYEAADGKIVLSSGAVFQEQDYCEYHCFNETEEYRVLTANGRRRELLISESEETNDPDMVVFREEQYLSDEYNHEGRKRKLVVVNRFCYKEYDSLSLEEYRLAGVIDE